MTTEIRPARRGMSLVEALVAITVMGTCSIMYASAWSAHSGVNDAANEIETATVLYLRQVERLRMKSLLDSPSTNGNQLPPIVEQAYQAGNCPPQFPGSPVVGQTYYAAQSAINQLSYNTPISTVLDAAVPNAVAIPANQPPDSPAGVCPTGDCAWVPALDPFLASIGYSVVVYASRVQDIGAAPTLAALNGTFPGTDGCYLNQLVKYRIKITRNGRHLLTGEILQEVR